MDPKFRKRAMVSSMRPCPMSLNIMPNKMGTVENMKMDGRI
jgi:hypothetical protein